jgi:aminoglycoside phosphotransferase (APT) family kinase protein
LLAIEERLVSALITDQFPQWVGMPVEPVPSPGTDNAIFRLGEDLAVRMPRVEWAAVQPQKEQRWLPQLAPQLPLSIPVPVGNGIPGHGYPWHWSVCPWLAGAPATLERVDDPVAMAADLAGFVHALHRIDTAGGPLAGDHNFHRGVPLAERDAITREAIDSLRDEIDADTVTRLWDEALKAPEWDRPPVWVHGDLASGNMLAADGRLAAVIDFGGLGIGDPACDMIVAWNLFSGRARDTYREATGVDDQTWIRGRGWALSIALVTVPYYRGSNPTIVAAAEHTLRQILADS